MTTRLITIGFSHYCEKARWALDRCGVRYVEEPNLPVLHYLSTYRVARARTVPVLVAGDTVLRDSTDIVAWADRHRPGSLIPATGADDALAIEDELDTRLGPATRRWAYFQLLPRRDADAVMTAGAPRWQRATLAVARPLAVSFLRRGLKIDEAGVQRSLERIEAALARADALLAGGRPYLAGGQFTVADLTFAALAAPILLPPEHPSGLSPDMFPDAARARIAAWRARPSGQHALSLYRRERFVPPGPPTR